ncbi:ARID1 AT-rich interaction domain protein [Giardia muris]|uniref:ARID1 AT-rich interaction domain protein n=1 Tax=Giardia muris TaxID=5742 RepID=A0A4Z1STD5_GIAMU|nr:ARID1 AT-rich interaction domain protein [Giardia muris]|eukprot:TNJ29010.1 ARID1 AT-rich interaction domain protein [Giardia muris]
MPSGDVSRLDFEHAVRQILRERRLQYFKTSPRVGRRAINLWKFYLYVQREGGFERVTNWRRLASKLGIGSNGTGASTILKKKYSLYFLPIENELRARYPIPEGVTDGDLSISVSSQPDSDTDSGSVGGFDLDQGFRTPLNDIVLENQTVTDQGAQLPDLFSPLGIMFNAASATLADLEAWLREHPTARHVRIYNLSRLEALPAADALPPALQSLSLIDLPRGLVSELPTLLTGMVSPRLSVQVAS